MRFSAGEVVLRGYHFGASGCELCCGDQSKSHADNRVYHAAGAGVPSCTIPDKEDIESVLERMYSAANVELRPPSVGDELMVGVRRARDS